MIKYCECGARHKFLDDGSNGKGEIVCPSCGRTLQYVLFPRGNGKSVRTLKFVYETFCDNKEDKEDER